MKFIRLEVVNNLYPPIGDPVEMIFNTSHIVALRALTAKDPFKSALIVNDLTEGSSEYYYSLLDIWQIAALIEEEKKHGTFL